VAGVIFLLMFETLLPGVSELVLLIDDTLNNHVGRIARRHLVGHGAVAAGQRLAQSVADPHLLRGCVLDPCPRLDGGPGNSDDQRPDGGPSVFFKTLMEPWT
jgi:hypothetical protein